MSCDARRSHGMTLIELMVSMVLGLIVIGGATSVILVNKQSYRTNEGLSQIQESARSAFELLARDVRQAAVTGCNNNGRVANVIDPTGTIQWWQTWRGIAGYDGAQADPASPFGNGTAVGDRVQGTSSVMLQGIEGTGISIADHNPNSAVIKLTAPTTEIADNDIVMICDFDHAAIFRVTNYNSSNTTLGHNPGQGQTPANCSKGLGYPTDCSRNANGNTYQFLRNAQIARFSAVDWYIGANTRAGETGRSLFRRRMSTGSLPEEIVANVTGLVVEYRFSPNTDFKLATDVNNANAWNTVDAVRITLTLQSADQRISSDNSANSGRIQRAFANVITLRNRVP